MLGRIANQYRKAFSGLPVEVWYLATVVLVNRAGSMVLPFLALYVTEGLKLDGKHAGWMLAIYGIGSCSGSFVGGLIADKVGPFRLQIFALLMSGLGYYLMSFAGSFSSLAVIVLLTSFTSDMFRPANAASVTLLSPPELHKRAFSLNRLAINLGYTLGPTVGGLLATVSYQFLFWIDGLTSWMAAATFIYFLGFRVPSSSRSGNEPVDHPAVESEGSDKPANDEPAVEAIRDVAPWRSSRFMLFLLLTFITFSVFFQLISTFPLFLKQDYGLSKVQIGSLFGANTLGVVAFEMVLIQLLDRKNLMRLIAWGSLLMCWGFGALPYGVGYWFALVTVSIWTLGEMLAMPQMLTYVAKCSSSRNRSLYMGCYTTCVALSMMIGPLVGTQLYEWDHFQCWHFATLIGIFVCVGFYWLDWTNQRIDAVKVETAENSETVGVGAT